MGDVKKRSAIVFKDGKYNLLNGVNADGEDEYVFQEWLDKIDILDCKDVPDGTYIVEYKKL